MKSGIHTKTFKTAIVCVLVGVVLCIAGPTMGASSHHLTSSSVPCQTMHMNLVGMNWDGKLLSTGTLFLFGILVYSFACRQENLLQQVATGSSPPPGSRWRLFQHAFFDTLYRQFSVEHRYVTAIVEPQTYSG